MLEPENAARFLRQRRATAAAIAISTPAMAPTVRNFLFIRMSLLSSRIYLSSQTSSMRQPLKMLLTISVNPLT